MLITVEKTGAVPRVCGGQRSRRDEVSRDDGVRSLYFVRWARISRITRVQQIEWTARSIL